MKGFDHQRRVGTGPTTGEALPAGHQGTVRCPIGLTGLILSCRRREWTLGGDLIMGVTPLISYFGTPMRGLIEGDFPTRESRRSITVTRDVLWESDTARQEGQQEEIEMILKLRSNDPAVGYNRSRRSMPTETTTGNRDSSNRASIRKFVQRAIVAFRPHTSLS